MLFPEDNKLLLAFVKMLADLTSQFLMRDLPLLKQKESTVWKKMAHVHFTTATLLKEPLGT